ncbi:MAG: amino acid permease [Deltaproteobacteria bacterium]|nr:amino acid permease [Candidatus Anaeroferrophillus wilburensis]MBN2888012.1 amino acid permease [Deltaproteobacteria bacterium]
MKIPKFLSMTGFVGRPSAPGRLGAFIGVYTPTVLTILGVIMYLRFGWVVGQVGLGHSLLIVVVANGITLITTLSLSAIATNSKVGIGGAYYMISRSLGREVGGAIGLPLYLSQALSVTLYAFGLAESLAFVWPGIPVAITAFLIIIAVSVLALRGAGFALKTQVPIMIMIGVSLLALLSGSLLQGSSANLTSSSPPTHSFWMVFAVFFPAVTGIMAGLSLSGDLEAPKSAIPKGTLWATLTGFAIYLIIPLLLSYARPAADLRAEPLIWTKIAVLGPWLIMPGLWGAIFSSAVGSLLGAPRTLQALSRDRLVPRIFTRVDEKNGEPLFGMAVTVAIAVAAIFLGGLNAVAQVVTMFFLTVYGTTNLVAALEQLSGNPSWRPSIVVPWFFSLLGALGCFGVMALINLPVSLLAIIVELAIWLLLKRRAQRESWGDVRRDIYEAVIRWALVQLGRHPMTARNWRPHVLVFVSNIEQRLNLVRFGAWFSEDRGVVTVCELKVGDLLDLAIDTVPRQRQIEAILHAEQIVAFGEVNVVPDIERGIIAVAQANGMAGIESNTILVGLPDEPERLASFLRIIRRLAIINRSLIIGQVAASLPAVPATIDIWWGGLQRNGDLMLLLAYLLSRNPQWHAATIRVLSVASNELMRQQTQAFLQQLMPEIRIEAEIHIFVREEEMSIKEMIHRESAAADVVLLGLAVPAEDEIEAAARRLQELAAGLPTCFFIHNGSLFIGDLVSPEQEVVQSRMPDSNREKT